MKPSVIHTIETAEPGGAEKVLVQIADGLRDDYVPTGVVLQEGWTSAELNRLGIPFVHMPLKRSFDISWVKRMLEYVREHNVRLIHSHEFTSNAYSAIVARLAGVPIICTVHGKNYYPDRYYRRFATRKTAWLANEFVAVSGDLKSYLVDQIAVPQERIKVILNGIDTGKFSHNRYDREALRYNLKLPTNAFVIIVVAALFEMKGHRDLMTAVSKLGSRQKDVCLLFVGDGPYRPSLQKQSAELHMTEIVRFAGFRSDIAEFLAASDLFVLPSYSEGLPISVLESMSAGVPVIATDVGGLREVVNDGVNACLVPPSNPVALAEKIRFCMDNPRRTSEMAEQAREDIVARFSMDAMLDSYRTLYSRLLTT